MKIPLAEAEQAAAAAEKHGEARAALTVVRRQGAVSLEERCARHLARVGMEMTPAELRDALRYGEKSVSAAAI